MEDISPAKARNTSTNSFIMQEKLIEQQFAEELKNSSDKQAKTRNQSKSPVNKHIVSRTIENEKPIDMSIRDEPDMFNYPQYDVDESDEGEPNVVDITDDFDSNSKNSKFDNNFESRRYTVQVKKSIEPKVMSNSGSFANSAVNKLP
jgi:hypothetical protein